MSVKVVLNPVGVRELLKSAGIKDDLDRRGKAIASAAGDGFEADTQIGKTRARCIVFTDTIDAMLAEANDRALTNAIDAGR